jgi:hypothetical protein
MKKTFFIIALIVLTGIGFATWKIFFAKPDTIMSDPVLVPSTTYEITEDHNGYTFNYPVDTKFTLTLEEQKHPQNKLVESTGDFIKYSPNESSIADGLYTEAFIAIEPGKTTITNRNFSIVVNVI